MTAAAPSELAQVPTVLLDLDGTVVDSAPGILAGLDHAFAACDEPHPGTELLRTFIGPPLTDSFRSVLGMSPQRAEQLRLAYSEHYVEHGFLASRPYPGMAELIRRLAAEGRTVAVATNKPEPIARRLIVHQGLDEGLALVAGTDRSAGRHGKAAVIASVLDRLGLRAGVPVGAPAALDAPAVMVGDRLHDAEGAAEHGLPAVLVGWGYGGAAERSAPVPFTETVEDLTALLLR